MDETENFNPKQSSAEFIPTEADWINLEKQVLELLNLQKQLEQKYNYEKVRTVSSYQDRAKYGLTALYGNLHPDSRSGLPSRSDASFFPNYKRNIQAWKDYLNWIENNQDFREAEWTHMEPDFGYFPDLRNPWKNKTFEEKQMINKLVYDQYGNDWIYYIEKSKERFAEMQSPKEIR